MISVQECRDQSVWEGFLLSNVPESVFQGWKWGELQRQTGLRVFRYAAYRGSTMIACVQIVEQRMGKRLVLWYSGGGPVISPKLVVSTQDKQSVLDAIMKKLKHDAPSSCVMFRFEPDVLSGAILSEYGFRTAFRTIRPTSTVRIRLSGYSSCDDILQQFKQKTRYNIRLAKKKGVEVDISSDIQSVDQFYSLLKETVARDRFAGNPKKHYELLLQTFGPDSAKVYSARYKGEVIASIIILYYNQVALYLYGASSSQHRNVMAPHLLQWEALKGACVQGFLWYDMFGAAKIQTQSTPWQIVDPNDPWAGVTKFKLGFVNNGRVGEALEYPGSFDFVLRPLLYKLLVLRRKFRS